MPTCRDIIIQALRMGGVIASGEEPTDDEANDGLFVLQGIYDRLFELGHFGEPSDGLPDEDVSTGAYVDAGERYVDDNGAWVRVDGFALADEAPFAATHGAAGLAALLGLELVSQFGGSMSAMDVRRANLFRSSLLFIACDPMPESCDYA